MVPIPRPALAVLVPLILVIQHAANATQSLAEAVKRADAKYLEAPDVEGQDSAPKIEAGVGEQNTTPEAQEISQGAVKAVRSYLEQRGEDDEIMRAPVVTMFADGKGSPGSRARTPASPIRRSACRSRNSTQAIGSPRWWSRFYTGGAHCCSATSVVTASPDGSSLTTVDVGEFDGGPLLATDLDGDGRYEF